ncbi:hypothetical protein MPER_04123, partial [Moniliophthora perniciosa FA553]
MGQAFRALKKMKEKLEEVRRALTPQGTLEISELVILARSLGHMQVDKKTPRNEINQFLKDLEKQLNVLVRYLDEKFKPTAERLASAMKYGYMEFDLLPYYFEPGQEVSIKRPYGDETCYHFPGTKELSELNVKLLTEEKRKELAARGTLYKDLAGIHY